MTDDDSLTWYINMSPFNKYLAIDVMKTLGATVLVVGLIQILPLNETIKTFIIDWGGVLMILYLASKVLRLFTAFNGISIRFILDETGATMIEDHKASGLKYVAQQVSTMRWDPMHAGSFRAADIKPRVPRLEWSDVSKVSPNAQSSIVVLHGSLGGSMRLFCSEDNYLDVLSYVNQKVSVERSVQ
jgi:hypothetical protein